MNISFKLTMMKLILGCVLLICVTFAIISARPAEENVSYIQGLNIQFENDKWICGDVECPADSNGCKIRLHTDADNETLLIQSFACIDINKTALISAGDIIEMPKARKINIDLESYKDAVSVYGSTFGLGGYESAQGTIAPEHWNDFKENAKGLHEEIGTVRKLDAYN